MVTLNRSFKNSTARSPLPPEEGGRGLRVVRRYLGGTRATDRLELLSRGFRALAGRADSGGRRRLLAWPAACGAGERAAARPALSESKGRRRRRWPERGGGAEQCGGPGRGYWTGAPYKYGASAVGQVSLILASSAPGWVRAAPGAAHAAQRRPLFTASSVEVSGC